MSEIAAGALSERITLQDEITTRSDIGETVTDWSEGVDLWASVTTVRGEQFFAALQQQYRLEIQVRIRWREGVHNRQRIIWRGTPYAVKEVMDGGPQKPYIEMLCASGERDAT